MEFASTFNGYADKILLTKQNSKEQKLRDKTQRGCKMSRYFVYYVINMYGMSKCNMITTIIMLLHAPEKPL